MNKTNNYKSNRNFGLVFSLFFLILAYIFRYNSNLLFFFTFIAIIFLILSFFKNSILTLPNKYWLKFGHFLGSIISPIVMGIIYFAVVYPTKLILTLLKKDILDLKINRNSNSYWKKKNNINSMDKQF